MFFTFHILERFYSHFTNEEARFMESKKASSLTFNK